MKKAMALPLLILLASCYNQERNCKDFKTGKFKFEQEINGEKKITIFERNDSIEIETYEGKTDTSSVRWVSDCEYILQKINPKSIQEKKAVDMEILATKGNSYTFEYSLVGDTHKKRGTATKIN